MPGRVALDVIDPVADGIVGVQSRRMQFGAACVLARFARPGQCPDVAYPWHTPIHAGSRQPLLQGEIQFEQVRLREGRRLVQRFLRTRAGEFDGDHAGSLRGRRWMRIRLRCNVIPLMK